jgi:hypothetical protein
LRALKDKREIDDMRERALYVGFSEQGNFYKPSDLDEFTTWVRDLFNIIKLLITFVIKNNLTVHLQELNSKNKISQMEVQAIRSGLDDYKIFFKQYLRGDYSKIKKLTDDLLRKVDDLLNAK